MTHGIASYWVPHAEPSGRSLLLVCRQLASESTLYITSFTKLEMLDYAAPGFLKRAIGKERCAQLTTIAMGETLQI